MTGEYPRATDTFIQREVAALRQRAFTSRRSRSASRRTKENVGAGAAGRARRTFYLLPAWPLDSVRKRTRAAGDAPGRYLSALRPATDRAGRRGSRRWSGNWRISPRPASSRAHMRDARLDPSAQPLFQFELLGRDAGGEMGGFTFSFTMHGPAEFFEPEATGGSTRRSAGPCSSAASATSAAARR